MQLSPNFSLAEICKSATGIRLGIDNTPSPEVIANLRALCFNVLEPVRTYFGRRVTVHSGYRGPSLNRAVGGARESQHMTGEAADIEIAGVANHRLAQWIADGNVPFDQVILEFYTRGVADSGWVHVSYRPHGRQSVLTAERVRGKTVYRQGLVA